MRVPGILWTFSTVWGLDAKTTCRFWGAVTAARWSEVAEWRRQVALSDHLPNRRLVAETLLTPGKLVQIFEVLTQEKKLTRRLATTLEEAVLAQVDAQGAWR